MSLAWPVIKDLLSLRERLNRCIEEAYLVEAPGAGEPSSGSLCPPADLFETDNEVVVIMELPGADVDSIDLKVVEDTLRVSGRISSSTEGETDRFIRLERANGTFYRDFRLPIELGCGDPTAELDRGVLTIRLPRSGSAPRRRVDIIEEEA